MQNFPEATYQSLLLSTMLLNDTYQDRTNRKMTDKLIKEMMALNEHFNPQLVEDQKLHVHV